MSVPGWASAKSGSAQASAKNQPAQIWATHDDDDDDDGDDDDEDEDDDDCDADDNDDGDDHLRANSLQFHTIFQTAKYQMCATFTFIQLRHRNLI